MIMPYLTPMNYRLDKDVDRFINDLLGKEPTVIKVTEFDTTLGIGECAFEIWTTNRWYAYASKAYPVREVHGALIPSERLWNGKRPSRKTMIRLYKYIKSNAPAPKPMPTVDEVLKEAA